MRLDDWRTAPADELAPLYAAEHARWLSTLSWDTSSTWQTVESARRAGTLPGFVLRDEGGAVRGWSFHLQHRGELQFGNLVSPSTHATEQLLRGVFQSSEARSANRWMAFGWFNAPDLVNLLHARGMGVESYRYLYRDVSDQTSAAQADGTDPHGLRAWQPADNVGLAALLSSAYQSADSARPFAANGTMSEWTEYASHLLRGSGCGAFDAATSRVAPGADRLDGAAVMTRLMPTTAHLAQLAVQPSAQGRGLGERLAVSALMAAADRGCSCVTLLVRDTNVAARRLYDRLGFTERAQFVSASAAIGGQLSAVS